MPIPNEEHMITKSLYKTVEGARRIFLCTPIACAALVFSTGCGMHRPPPPGPIETVEGNVERLTTAPRGETDGAILTDGTILHWPPHMGDRFALIAERGDLVRATGTMREGPKEARLEVIHLRNLRTNVEADNGHQPPP